MEPKAPVMLLVLVETARLRWFVAAIGLDGRSVPLLRSEVGDLAKYQGFDFDEQVAFLRHRFCGVLQRGCDRIWARDSKACHFVFVFEGLLPDATGRLTQAIAEHFSQWMLNPPVVVFHDTGGPGSGEALRLERLAGQLDRPLEELLLARLDGLRAAQEDPSAWELSWKKSTWPGG
jgi:hypothetical protein